MSILILCIIYAAFVSLGLPDGMLGAAWPTIRNNFGVPLGYAGFISLTISAGTIMSSLFGTRLLKRFGTGKVTAGSVLLTAVGLFGFSLASTFWQLFLFAVPLGIGAGAVDSGLNEYVAEHYGASHMNFLHSFWGIGALGGPLVMSAYIRHTGNWHGGYRIVSVIQFVLVLILALSLPLWQKAERADGPACEGPRNRKKGLSDTARIRGLKEVLAGFMAYAGMEVMLGLWGASYLVGTKGFDSSRAAAWVSLFYVGITAGRFLCGLFTVRFSGKLLIRIGGVTILAGICCFLTGLYTTIGDWCTLAGFILFGLGCAPIFPGMLHETPARFGRENAQAVMGFQLAVSYTSATIMPPLFGLIATVTTVKLLPWVLCGFAVVLIVSSERSNRIFSAA